MLRTLFVAAASAALVVVAAPAAVAADLPAYEPAPAYAAPVPASNWTGAYLGAQAGYAWGKSRNRGGAPTTHPDGGTVGAFAGYNYQFEGSPAVVGLETDINYDTADAKRNYAPGSRVKNETNWSGATRARIGYGGDHVLVYGAGGVAYADETVKRRTPAGAGSDSKTAVGYTVGGGVEALVTPNVTARVNYRYNDYGTEKFKVGGGSMKSELTENRLTAGVAYKFGN